MGRPCREKQYILFSGKEHEALEFLFPRSKIERFKKLWDQGASLQKMCKELRVNEWELTLISIDLYIAGAINERPKGIFGGESA